MNLNYDIATRDDIGVIVKFKLEMFKEAGIFELLHENASAIIQEDYSKLYDLDTACHRIARCDDNIVAMAGAFIKSDLPYRYFKQPEYGFIGDVYTLPEYRELGISTRLNKEALNWIQEKGINTIRLLASDKGRSNYERLGFRDSEEMVLTI